MLLVVDASVARSATAGPGGGGAAARSTAALEAIRDSENRVAFNAELNQEWLRHQGAFGRSWFMQMLSTRRVERVSRTWEGQDALLTAAGDLAGNNPEAVAKDAHLVSLAMVTDQRVVSNDTRQRTLLARLLPQVPELGGLYWTSPMDRSTVPWLAEGAPANENLTLSSRA